MRKRIYHFNVDNKKYLFDGNTYRISMDSKNEKFVSAYCLYDSKPNDLRTLCLVLNNSCNLCCQYCYANKGRYNIPNEQLSLQKTKKFIDIFANSVIRNNFRGLAITFFGGEPLLSFGLIKEIVTYIEDTYPQIDHFYKIVTNGTLLTTEETEFFKKYAFNIIVSLDGSEEKHDFYRKDIRGCGSYKTIINNLKQSNIIETVMARITISEKNANIAEDIYDLLKQGIKKIMFAVDYNISDRQLKKYCSSLRKMFRNYLKDIRRGYIYEIGNIGTIIFDLTIKRENTHFCNAGVSYLALSADSKLYLCHRFIGKEDFMISETSNEDTIRKKIELFKNSIKETSNIKNSLKCQKCPFLFLCGKACFHASYQEHTDLGGRLERDCLQKRILFSETIKFLTKLSDEERQKIYRLYNIPSYGVEFC